MTPSHRTFAATVALAAVIAALAGLIPSKAAAQDYDMDCKLLLCMPGGFPSGCSDADNHMVDRSRDGRSPIGFCAKSNGEEYAAYEIDYRIMAPTTPEGWQCPQGKTLYHRTSSEDRSARGRIINTFCYDTAYTRTGWSADGNDTVTTYTNKTPPARRDFWVSLTLEPGTTFEFSQGWQTFDTGRPPPDRPALHGVIRIALLLWMMTAPAAALAQVGCLPPEEPFAYAPPKDDPELRDLIDAQYQDYIRDTQSYLNCLNAESMRARNDYAEVLKRYV